jgi:plastocyanin
LHGSGYPSTDTQSPTPYAPYFVVIEGGSMTVRSVRSITLAAAAIGVAAVVAAFAGAPAGAASKPPVTLGQKVNFKGTKDVSKKSSATVDEELDDYYFEPTFIKAKAGEKITFNIDNEGKMAHTFTSDVLNVDKELQPGKSAKVTVTVPSDGALFQFHCSFHESQGMAGGVFTKPGVTATTAASS